jgi:hypothetical protein
LYYFHLRALDVVGVDGVPNASGTTEYGPIWIETGPPSVVGMPYLDAWEGAVYVVYSEADMVGADSAGNYEMSSGVTDIAVVSIEDVSNEKRIFRLQINNFDPYLIYRLTIKENITDYAGNLLTGQREFTLNDDYDSDGLSNLTEYIAGTDPLNPDSDGDGIQDGTELGCTLTYIGQGTDTNFFQPDLDPATKTDPTTRDSDGDGWDDGQEDLNHNGRVDAGESDPNSSESKPPEKGDVDWDGDVDLADAIITLQVVSGIQPITPVYKTGDVNGDGKIGLEEAIFILQKISGLRP